AALSSPAAGPARPPAELPDLVVLAPAGGLPAAEAPRLVAHLLAEIRGEVGVVGPFVAPGASACLRCLDLTRADRDPGWPALAVQLDLPARGVTPCDSALALAVAAQASLQALEFLDTGSLPATAGGTLELVLPGWRWRRRSWQVHPDCDCVWRDTS
ncbi:MAG: UBA/THIF-type binding protein, partial [Frankiales bacterium]|nr:UBA/THIF-type binding protein [Frankiales bacterium]